MKKGQVTAFIIIGLIVLVLGILVYFLAGREVGFEPVEVSTEALPLQNFVQNCLDVVSKDALVKLGSHGGYISLDETRYNGGRAFRYSPVLTESDAVTMVDDGEKIPYWFHMGTRNNCASCEFVSAVPTIDEMEEMMNNYVEDNLNTCIGNLEGIREQGFDIVEAGEFEVKTQIADQNVNFVLNYPVTARIGGSEIDVNDYFVSQNVDLMSVYDMAGKIHDTQAETPFIEYTMLHVISSLGRVDSSALPPISDAKTGAGKVVWSVFDVEDKLREQIGIYTSLLTIEGSQNFYPPVKDLNAEKLDVLQGPLFPFIINILPTNRRYDHIAASFNYIDSPTSLYFDINPRDGALIRPDELSNNFFNMFQFFLNTYEFSYDLSYPVIVELRDTNAFNGEGYSFTFALESNIRANNPLLTSGGPRIALSEQTTLFNSEKQKISGEITVTTVSDSGNRLGGVSIHYLCGNAASYIGETNDNGVLISRFPICSNGEVMFEKQGFLGKRKAYNTKVGKSGEIGSELLQLRPVVARINVIPRDFVDNLQSFKFSTVDEYKAALEEGLSGSTENLEVYVTLTRIDDPVYTTSVVLGSGMQEIDLVSGRYSIGAYAVDTTGQPTIPSEIRTVEYEDCQTVVMQIFGGCKTRIIDYELPELESRDRAYVGGIQIDNTTIGWFDITKEDLMGGKTMEIQVVRSEVPTTHDELIGSFDISGMTTKAGNFARPRWK